jgi:hypothetical protein
MISSLLLSLLYSPPVDRLWIDQTVFRYAGMLIAKGGVPYVDLFDHKPPLIYFLDWFGGGGRAWGAWIIDALFTAGATLFFYKRCCEKQLPFPVILPLLFNLLLRNYFVCSGMGLTREYTAIFLLIAFCVLMGRSRYMFFWLGLLGAATFFMQQEQVLAFLPFFVYGIGTNLSTARQFLLRVTQAAAGSLVIAGPLLLFFAAHHALTACWRDAFLFNMEWYADKHPFGELYRSIHVALSTSEVGLVLFISSTLAVTAILLRSKKSGLIFVTLVANGLAFAPELISGRLIGLPFYYLAPFSATLAIQVFTVWTAADHSFLSSRISHAVFGFLVCAPVLYNAIQHAAHLRLDNDKTLRESPEYLFLRRQPLSDYQAYVFGRAEWADLYIDFRILAPTSWIYFHFWTWYPRWDRDRHIFQSIGRDLLAHRTRYVADFSDEPEFRFADPTAYRWWKTFLQEHYHLLNLPAASNTHLWELNPVAGNIPYELPH